MSLEEEFLGPPSEGGPLRNNIMCNIRYTFTNHIYTYTYTHAHIHAYTHTHIHTYTHTHIHTYTHTHIHTYTHTHIHTYQFGDLAVDPGPLIFLLAYNKFLCF